MRIDIFCYFYFEILNRHAQISSSNAFINAVIAGFHYLFVHLLPCPLVLMYKSVLVILFRWKKIVSSFFWGWGPVIKWCLQNKGHTIFLKNFDEKVYLSSPIDRERFAEFKKKCSVPVKKQNNCSWCSLRAELCLPAKKNRNITCQNFYFSFWDIFTWNHTNLKLFQDVC